MDWPDWLTCRAIHAWPGTLTSALDRRSSPFKAPLTTTVSELERELRLLNTIDGTDVLQLALRERDIRLDGKPRADARPAHPGVILSFSTRATSEEFLSRDHARAFLVGKAGQDWGRDKRGHQMLYREAAKFTHPDTDTGSEHDFRLVQEAYRLLTAEDAIQFAVDTYTYWQDNLRAIVLGMEALRKVSRYGIVKGNQQYTGWKQLTA